MGRYTNWPDIVGRYPDAAKIAGNESTGSYWLMYAEAEIDARLAPRFTTPFSSAPDVVKDIVIDMTYYRMTLRQKGSDVIKKFIDERITGLIDGTIFLPSSSATDKSIAWSEQDKTGYHTAFGPDDDIFWRVSSTFIRDTQDERGQY